MSVSRRQRRLMQKQHAASITPSPIARAEAQQHYRTGLNIGFAWQGIKECELMVTKMIEQIIVMVVITQGLPASGQGKRVRSALLELSKPMGLSSLSWAQQMRLEVSNLRDAVRQGAPTLATPDGSPLNLESGEYFARTAMELADLVSELTRDIDPELPVKDYNAEIDRRMKPLRDYVTDMGGMAGIAVMGKLQDSTPRPGAKSEPRPITKFVLDETRNLGRLHTNLKTRGMKFERLISELRGHADIKAWQQYQAKYEGNVKLVTSELIKRSVEVQTFEMYKDFNQQQLGEALDQMEKNNPRWRG